MNATAAHDAPRLLPLEGGFNLRDFGGYPTMDGRHVRRGVLYRSGTMTFLTEADERHLGDLGIAVVCDLRRPNECQTEPTRWCEPAGVTYWSRDYQETSGALAEIVRRGAVTVDEVREAMLAVYRDIPVDHAPSYRAIFDRLLNGEVPLLLNCTAGKDRTGVAAALILHALGVSREMIVEDYLQTNSHADFSRFTTRPDSPLAKLAVGAEMLAPLYAADADYLAEAFAEFDRNHGGIDGYLHDMLGVDADARARLRSLLVA